MNKERPRIAGPLLTETTMSRFQLEAKTKERSAAAGWSAPLDSYFFEVRETNTVVGGEHSIIARLGTTTAECQSVDVLLNALAEHAHIPHSLRTRLINTRDNEPHDPTSVATVFHRHLDDASIPHE